MIPHTKSPSLVSNRRFLYEISYKVGKNAVDRNILYDISYKSDWTTPDYPEPSHTIKPNYPNDHRNTNVTQ